MQRDVVVRLVEKTLESSLADEVLFITANGIACSSSPVLVHGILQMDTGQITNVVGQRKIDVEGLQGGEKARGLLPVVQLLCTSLDLVLIV